MIEWTHECYGIDICKLRMKIIKYTTYRYSTYIYILCMTIRKEKSDKIILVCTCNMSHGCTIVAWLIIDDLNYTAHCMIYKS